SPADRVPAFVRLDWEAREASCLFTSFQTGSRAMDSNGNPDRRTFLATVGAASAVGMIRPTVGPSARAAGWDLSWLDGLKGKHKQVFDLQSLGMPLHAAS